MKNGPNGLPQGWAGIAQQILSNPSTWTFVLLAFLLWNVTTDGKQLLEKVYTTMDAAVKLVKDEQKQTDALMDLIDQNIKQEADRLKTIQKHIEQHNELERRLLDRQ